MLRRDLEMDEVATPFEKMDVWGLCGVERQVRGDLSRALSKELHMDDGVGGGEMWSDDVSDFSPELLGNLFRMAQAKEKKIYST